MPKSKAPRDHRLDFWRGLCLIDMLLVHVIHQGMSLGHEVDLWIGEYTRFAAGGFVFIAGLSIGRIFMPRARDPAKRWPTYRALWRRSLVILVVHYVAEVGFLLMWPLYGGYGFKSLWTAVGDVLVFRAGYDLLPLYVVMVALAPGMIELVRRGLWWVLAAASVAVFAAAHVVFVDVDPLTQHVSVSVAWFAGPHGPGGTALWNAVKLPIQHDFFPVLWQVVFVTGLLAAEVLPKYDALARRWKLVLLAGLATAHVVLFIGYYGPNFGLHLWLPLTFQKVPLTAGEALRYLTLIAAIMVATDLVWQRRLAGGVAAQFAERLGRNSLPVYVFHVWVVQAVVHGSTLLHETTARVLLALAGVGALWVFASLLEANRSTKKGAATKGTSNKGTGADGGGERSVRPSRRWSAASLARLPIGGLPALAAATVFAVYLGNTVQRHLSRKLVGGRQPVASAASELLSPKSPEVGPDYNADPADDDIDPGGGDEEEQPTGGADPVEGGAQAAVNLP